MNTSNLPVFTKEEAIRFAESGEWKDLTFQERAAIFFHNPLLCMPFSVAHEAVEKVLGRGVWTHEFAKPELLIDKWNGRRDAPTFAEILAQIPRDKIVLGIIVKEEGK